MKNGLSLKIKTKLVGREEAFRIIAVGHATGLPILLVGPPGTGKTNVLLDYMDSSFKTDENEIFILEVDEGSRSHEVKGNINFKKLIEQNVFEKYSPITKAKGILINEIDKSTSGLRNAFLGIMNEKVLFDGEQKIPCEYEIFMASCNEIPTDEKNSPFWDRFIIKYNVERVPRSLLVEFLTNNTEKELNIYIPSQDDMNKVKFKDSSIEAFVNICHNSLTDRSILHIREIAPAVKWIYGLSPDRALVKATYLIGGKNLAESLSKTIEPAEIISIRNMIQAIIPQRNIADIKKDVENIAKNIQNVYDKNLLEEDVFEELKEELQNVLTNHPVYVSSQQFVEEVDVEA